MTEDDWTHVIAKHPEYANKLGIITAEWSALEWLLCDLFGVLLGTDRGRAEAVFFTVRSNRSRCEAVESLATLLLSEGSELRHRIDRILRRIGKAASRRNSMAHSIWHFGEAQGSGSAISFERYSGTLRSVPIDITELDQLISQLRILRKDTHTLAIAAKEFLTPVSPSP